MLTYFAIRHDVIRVVLIQFVNFFARHELIDFDGALTLNRDGFKLFWVELKIFALADLVSFDDVGGFNFVTGLCIDLAILDAITGVFVELVETDFFSLAGCRKQRDRT